MIKLCSFVLIASLFLTSPAFGQEINRAQLQQVTKVEPARASYLLPPQGQPPAAAQGTPATKVYGTSHKKRNIIIAVVVGVVVAGVIVAATNGSGGGSGY